MPNSFNWQVGTYQVPSKNYCPLMALFNSRIVILSCTLLIRLSVLSLSEKFWFSPQGAGKACCLWCFGCTLKWASRNLNRTLARYREYKDISLIVQILLQRSTCVLKKGSPTYKTVVFFVRLLNRTNCILKWSILHTSVYIQHHFCTEQWTFSRQEEMYA